MLLTIGPAIVTTVISSWTTPWMCEKGEAKGWNLLEPVGTMNQNRCPTGGSLHQCPYLVILIASMIEPSSLELAKGIPKAARSAFPLHAWKGCPCCSPKSPDMICLPRLTVYSGGNASPKHCQSTMSWEDHHF